VVLLSTRGVTRCFGGLTALDGVSIDVHEGEIKAIIGPNGAGKSTLFNVVTGFDRPDAGEVTFDGRTVTGEKPHRLVRSGMARTFQNTQLFEDLSVLENVLVGMHAVTRAGLLASAFRAPRVAREERLAREEAHRLLRLVGLDGAASTPAADLPHGTRRLLEIARALATGPRLLLLDEPAAGLNTSETRELAALLFKVRAGGRLVEQQEARTGGECAGDLEQTPRPVWKVGRGR
jgi:ABC-type branched-subunit amino acid transport system ATPase component